jgi:hypothetical protein
MTYEKIRQRVSKKYSERDTHSYLTLLAVLLGDPGRQQMPQREKIEDLENWTTGCSFSRAGGFLSILELFKKHKNFTSFFNCIFFQFFVINRDTHSDTGGPARLPGQV